jgi:hypothetical protein
LKLLGHLHFVDMADADDAIAASVALPGYRATVERVALFDVVAFDWNCPQHITQRFTADEVEADHATARGAHRDAEAELRHANLRAAAPR